MTAHTPDGGGLTEVEREALDLAFIDAKVGSTKALFYAAERIKADAYAAGLAARTAPDTEAVAAALESAADDLNREGLSLKAGGGGWGSNPADQQAIAYAVNVVKWLRARAAGVREGREG